MSRKVEAIKSCAVALGFASATTDFNGKSTTAVLKELAVMLECAETIGAVGGYSATDVLEYIAKNYGEDDNPPYALSVTASGATVQVKRGNKVLSQGDDVLNDGDKITITATAEEGKTLTVLTVNGEDFASGSKHTVNGAVAIVATATEPAPEADPEPEEA